MPPPIHTQRSGRSLRRGVGRGQRAEASPSGRASAGAARRSRRPPAAPPTATSPAAGCPRGGRRPRAALRCSSHGGISTQATMPPISMLALMRRPMMMPEPMLRSETPKPSPTRPEKSLTIERNRVANPLQHRRQEDEARRRRARPSSQTPTCAPAGPWRRAAISVSPAAMPSGNGRFSSSMKCLRSGTARNTPSRPDADSHAKV